MNFTRHSISIKKIVSIEILLLQNVVWVGTIEIFFIPTCRNKFLIFSVANSTNKTRYLGKLFEMVMWFMLTKSHKFFGSHLILFLYHKCQIFSSKRLIIIFIHSTNKNFRTQNRKKKYPKNSNIPTLTLTLMFMV